MKILWVGEVDIVLYIKNHPGRIRRKDRGGSIAASDSTIQGPRGQVPRIKINKMSKKIPRVDQNRV